METVAENPKDEVYIGRQPILDRRQAIIGYELLFRTSRESQQAGNCDPVMAPSRVIVDTFTTVGPEAVLGPHLAFLNLTREILMSEVIEILPPRQVVLEILEDIKVDREIIERCQELKSAGYKLAIDDYIGEADRELLFDLMDFIKVDFTRVPANELRLMVRRLRRTPARLLAEKVEEREQFELCHKIGFDLFQGYYFARPVVVTGRSLDPSRAALLQLLEQIERDAEIDEIANTFKQYPNLGMNLLRIVNCAAFARPCKIGTVKQAVAFLGRRQLRRWLLLLMFAGDGPKGLESPLLLTASLRGRLMELLVRAQSEGRDSREYQDRAFLTGMLSLGDALLGVTRADLVRQVNVEQDIEEALLEYRGLLGDYLQLAEKLESAEFAVVGEILQRRGMNAEQLRKLEIDAYAWVHSLQRSGFDGEE